VLEGQGLEHVLGLGKIEVLSAQALLIIAYMTSKLND
jgi:hypothetical protein